jgi:prolipoprotein diacylglyceryltransferase
MLQFLKIGPLSIPLPEFTILIGVWLGIYLAEKKASRSEIQKGFLERLLLISLLVIIIGGRLSYLARHPEAFSGNFLSILSLNYNLFDLSGGLLIAILVAYVMINKKEYYPLAILDNLTPFFGTMISSLYLSYFFSGDHFGTITNIPWAINLWGAYRHPVQLYYLIPSLAVLLYSYFDNRRNVYAQGASFFRFSLLSAGYLMILSPLEYTDSTIQVGLRIDQIGYWFIILFSLLYFNYPLLIKAFGQKNENQG